MYGDPWREQIYSKTELTDPSQNDKGWQTARVAAIERATSRIKNFSLAPQTPFQFYPGQHVDETHCRRWLHWAT
jgi:hypothetical protein